MHPHRGPFPQAARTFSAGGLRRSPFVQGLKGSLVERWEVRNVS